METKIFKSSELFTLESGYSIENLQIAYTDTGFAKGKKTVWVCHALSEMRMYLIGGRVCLAKINYLTKVNIVLFAPIFLDLAMVQVDQRIGMNSQFIRH
jgi:hypothetical protein